MTARVAVYFAPEPGSDLACFGASWLGRDAATGLPVPPPVVPGVSYRMQREITATARHYGFHATLKPPFELAVSRSVFAAAVRDFAARMPSFQSPPLAVSALDGFLALVPTAPCPELRRLADECVREFHECAARPGEEEMAKRRAASLSLRQEQYLRWWGYPYVFEDFRFHMTLTGRLPDPSYVQRALATLYEPLAARPLQVDAICVFEQPDRDSPFRMTGRYPLLGGVAASGDLIRA